MIRPLETRDLPRLRELSGTHEWTFGPDFMGALVLVDAEDSPVMVAGGWRLAEVHLALDTGWGTPAMRLAALAEIHEAMVLELRAAGVGQAVTWLVGMKAFCRRLTRLGWKRSELTSWHRGI